MWTAALAVLLLGSPDSVALTRVEVAEGETLHVALEGAGRPVLVIPGLFGAVEGFSRVGDSLAGSGYRVLVVEPLGVGSSSRPKHADYTLTAQAERMARLIRQFDMQPAIIVAHSVSAAIGLRLAILHPELVATVISLEGGPTETIATPGLRRALKLAPILKLLGSGPLRGRIAHYLRDASGDPTWLSDSVVRVYTRGPARDLGATLGALRRMVDAAEPWALAPALDRIACPVILVQGLAPHEGGPDQAAREQMKSIPRFTLAPLPGVGHYAFEEAPNLVVDVIRHAAPNIVTQTSPRVAWTKL
jgi:pimeloyl-ACP methyl ester carboxylesterase